MTEAQAVERAIRLMADASARVLATISGADASVADLTVEAGGDEPLADIERPVVVASVAFVGAVAGDNQFLLAPDQATELASAMMGGALESDGTLGEIELSAIAEAMNQMMGSACAAISDELAIEADIAPPQVRVLEDGDDLELEAAAHVARFALRFGDHSAQIVQVIPELFARKLQESLAQADQMRDLVGATRDDAMLAADDTGDEDTLDAVRRTARISADSAATVLTTLLGVDATATAPEIEVAPEDVFGAVEFPMVAVEVAYVSGVTGANLFMLSPAQAARLAAIMMGLEEPMGDGLSDIELSAVSESMNQMMGAATNVMADTLAMDIEVSPPTTTVVDSIEAAKSLFGDCAYCSRFQLASGPFTADVMQLVSADFAEHLRQAYATAAAARGVVAEIPGVAQPAGDEPELGMAPDSWGEGIVSAAGATDYDERLLRGIRVRVSAELGRAQLPVARVANLPAGAVVKLDRSPADAVDVLINGCPFAQARLVLVDGEYAVQIVSLTPLEVAA